MKILPDQEQVYLAYSIFGRCSETFLRICSSISEHIRSKSGDVIDVWAAYRCNEFIADEELKIVFVAITKTGNIGISEGNYEIFERGKAVFSDESDKVLAEVENGLSEEDKFSESDLSHLERCVSKNAASLMKNHRNLSIVSPSVKKSIKFGKQNAMIYDQLCITLYVHIKGLIPIAEEPFPFEIGEFPTDVLEGGVKLFHGGPYDYHENLRMGLAVHANVSASSDGVIGGTLGGFIDHPIGMCALTCAHIVLSTEELLQLNTCKQINFSQNGREVFQLVKHETTNAFGRVLSAFFSEGGDDSPGMEVALVKIEDRFPTNGSFPASSNYTDAGFDENNPMLYNTGKVSPMHKIRRRTEVYKYGISTEVTRGSLGFRGSVVRTSEMSVNNQLFEFHLHNQIEVLRTGDKCFALPGDSGALVFFDDAHGDSVAFGILVGGHTNNRIVYVTPICEILHNIGVPVSMTKFINGETASPNLRISEVVTEDMDTS